MHYTTGSPPKVFCPPGGIWQYMQTFLIITTVERGKGKCTIDIKWLETKTAAKYPTMHRPAAHNKKFSNPNYQ